MHDAFAVRGVQRVRRLNGVAQRLLKWQRALERLAVNQFHDEVIGPDIVQRANMWMVQRGDGVRFAFEPLGKLFGGNLDGDGAVETRVARLIHFSHTSCAEGREDLIGSQTSPSRERHTVERFYLSWSFRLINAVLFWKSGQRAIPDRLAHVPDVAQPTGQDDHSWRSV